MNSEHILALVFHPVKFRRNMSTRFRAWLIGAVAGTSAVGMINYKFIELPQREILLNLRRALVQQEVRAMNQAMQPQVDRRVPLLSRESLNMALIAISDRFIFQHTKSE